MKVSPETSDSWETEMKKVIFVAAGLTFLGVPAYAGSCPSLVQKIDEAMQTAELSDEDKAAVMELRNKGEEQHTNGQHDESVATLNEALAKLGM